MIKVKDLCKYDLPQAFVTLMEKESYCDSCGAEMEVTDGLTALYCPNPSCPSKTVFRMLALVKDLSIKNLGVSRCEKILDYWDVKSPYVLLVYNPSNGYPLFEGASMEFSESIYEQLKNKTSFSLWEYVRLGNFQGLRDSARYLFKDYNNLTDFYNDLEVGGVDFVADLLQIKKDGVSIRALTIYQTLLYAKEELMYFEPYVNIEHEKPILLCLTGETPLPYKTKEDFIMAMNKKFKGKYRFGALSSVTNDCVAVVCADYNFSSNKMRKAHEKNKAIITYGDFESKIESIINGGV